MDSDFSENEPETKELAKPKEDSPDLEALSYHQPDNLDDVIADDARDNDSSRIENQFDASDAKADVDFDVSESANDDSPSLGDHSLESSTTSSSVNSPVDPVGTFPADASHSASKAKSAVQMERQRHSELQSSPPESISQHGIEHRADRLAADGSTFAIDSSMSSNPLAETPVAFAPDSFVGETTQASMSTPGDAAWAKTGSQFGESVERHASRAAQAVNDFARLSHSNSGIEPNVSRVDTNDEAISALLRHNWDKGIPLSEEAFGFRMPPLLLEVSRTDYQSRIEKIEEAAAAHLNRIINERIEIAMDDRDFMRAAEIRALLR